MPKAKRAKVWLYFTAKDSDIAKCNKCFKTIMCKGGSTSNVLKHAATHRILLKAEGCTVFDSSPWSWDILPNVSALSNSYLCVQASSTPSESFILCRTCHKSGEVSYLAKKANMVILLQKSCLKFEAGLGSIPTQHLFCCYLLIV